MENAAAGGVMRAGLLRPGQSTADRLGELPGGGGGVQMAWKHDEADDVPLTPVSLEGALLCWLL